MSEWFKVEAKADETVATVKLYDVIGDWIDDLFGFGDTAKSFSAALDAIPKSVKTLSLRINSPGGDVFGALAMASTLRAWAKARGAKIVAYVDGLAASAATLPMMAADEIHVADNALVMIHNPWSGATGNAVELRKHAEVLDKIRDGIVATYQWHSELDAEDLFEMMDAETWMCGEDAKTYGFATHVDEGRKAVASIAMNSATRVGLNVPEEYRERYDALVRKAPEVVPDVDLLDIFATDDLAPPYDAAPVIAACVDASLTLGFAQKLIEASATPDEIADRIGAERLRLNIEAVREMDIRALCERFDMTDLADGLVAGGLSAEAARRIVASVKAKLDRVEIDSGLPPDAGSPRLAVIDARAIYAARKLH